MEVERKFARDSSKDGGQLESSSEDKDEVCTRAVVATRIITTSLCSLFGSGIDTSMVQVSGPYE